MAITAVIVTATPKAITAVIVTVTAFTMTVSAVTMPVSAFTIAISAVTMAVSAITMSVTLAVSVMVIASVSVAIQIRVVADRFVIWLKFLNVTEGSSDVRSIYAVGKFDLSRARVVKNLNGEVLFATFVEFFVQRVVQPFGLVDTFSFVFSGL